MKKNYLFKTILFLIPFSAFILMSNSGGKTGGFSGSTGDSGTTCSNCHSGGNFNASMSITTNIPVTGYELDTDYSVTVNISSTANKHGFNLTAEKISDNGKIGTFTTGSDSQLTNSNANVTHTSSGNTQNSWTVTWRSPSTDQGRVAFHAAGIAANGSGTSGDQVVTANSGSISSLSIDEANQLVFSLYPNPSIDAINIQLPSQVDQGDVHIYDLRGRKVKTALVSSVNPSLNINELSSGIYIVHVLAGELNGTQKFVKQ